jgi:hypothetical protein
MADPLFLMTRAATEYLGCSRKELFACIKPDRRLPGDAGTGSGARLWLRQTLDAAKPQIDAWRERDRLTAEAQHERYAAEQHAQKECRASMRKNGALIAGKVREALDCTLTELNRWAADGRLPPDGEIFLFGACTFGKSIYARAWLPATIKAAKASLDDWRAQDRAKKIFKRRGLRPIA